MRCRIDPFPNIPEGFHLRVEETLMGLKEKEMRRENVYKRKLVTLIAAVLILVLGATAIAVVQGNKLRTRMQAGGENLAVQVQDVHMTARDGDFSFTIDEAFLNGEVLYLSYTVAVPEDGNVYLFSPYQMHLNDEPIASDLDAEFFSLMHAIGGEYGSSASRIIQLHPDADLQGAAETRLDCSCVFMLAQRPLAKKDAEEFEALFTEADAVGNANQLMKNADILYYVDTSPEGDTVPMVYLHYYPEIRAIFEAKGKDVLTAEDVESIGLARLACRLDTSIPIQNPAGKAARLNDVTQHVYFMDGYSIEIKELSISNFETRFKALIRREDGEFIEWTEEEPFGQYYFLCNADGSDFGRIDYCISSGETVILEDGDAIYSVSGECGGIFPVEGLTEVYLAPETTDAKGTNNRRDMERSISLMPFCNPEIVEHAPIPTADPAETDDLSS